MKKILFLLLFPVIGFAQNQYVDSSYTGSSTGSISQPWKTMSAINQGTLNAGDSVLFKRGYNYPGSMNITKGGTVGNAIVYTSYGTGTRAKFIGTGSTIAALFYMNGPDYLTFTNLNISDPTLNSVDPTRAQLSKIQRAFYVDELSNNIITSYMDVELVGVGVYWVGGSNAMLYCRYHNMRMVVNTNEGFQPGNDDDYGSNPVTCASSNNLVSHNDFDNLWAFSYDYTKDGGAMEMYNPGGNMNNNIFEYNKVYYGIGVFEITGNTSGLIMRFNQFINNGGLFTFQPGYTHASVTIENNILVLTVVSPVGDGQLFYGNPQNLTLRNNLFYMRAGCDVASSGTGITESYNSYDLGASSTVGYTLGTGSATGGGPYWVTMTGDPTTWDYHVISNIAGVPGGTGLNIDYYGVTGINDYKGVAKFIDPAPPATNQIKFPVKINGKVYMKFQ